jgi:hypothetical protein
MFIYLTINKVNDKKYIGMCTRSDNNYLGSGALLKKAIKKYGKENFERHILYETNNFEDLCEKEKQFIIDYDAVNNDEYYNIADGGHGGSPKTVENIWNNRTIEERENISKKISNTRKEKGLAKGEKNSMFGRSTSKIVENIWNNRTIEERENIGKKISETKRKTGAVKGEKNPMFGRSIIKENNLKWYTNGEKNIYASEDKQPEGFWRGRTNLSGKIGKRKHAE